VRTERGRECWSFEKAAKNELPRQARFPGSGGAI